MFGSVGQRHQLEVKAVPGSRGLASNSLEEEITWCFFLWVKRFIHWFCTCTSRSRRRTGPGRQAGYDWKLSPLIRQWACLVLSCAFLPIESATDYHPKALGSFLIGRLPKSRRFQQVVTFRAHLSSPLGVVFKNGCSVNQDTKWSRLFNLSQLAR